jgi:hypothetical protein
MVPLRFRVQDWLAHHWAIVPFAPDRIGYAPGRPVFVYPMIWPHRLLLALFGLVALSFAAVTLAIIGFLVWSLISS